jgi:large subunit ribosomal protein L13
MKTRATKASEIARQWVVVDATGQTLGRLASQVAQILSGKGKPSYSPYLDMGDYVVVVNAEKIHVTGNKMQQKIYYRHTGYPSGLREESLEKALQKHPTRVLERAVRGMLPKGPRGNAILRKLKVYAGPEHPHQAQIVGQNKESQQD